LGGQPSAASGRCKVELNSLALQRTSERFEKVTKIIILLTALAAIAWFKFS
jgi:hypothetical protein